MLKRLLICAFAIVFVAALTVSADKGKEGSWTGWVTDSHCAAKDKYDAKHASCGESCVKDHGAKWVLYTPADKKAYTLDPQDKATGHAGHHVKVTGTVEGDTIKVKSLEMVAEGGKK